MFVVFANSTRGDKYRIQLEMASEFDAFPGTFQIREFTNGRSTACACLGNKSAQEAVAEYNRRIELAAQYDGIKYTKNAADILGEVI